MTNTQLNKVEFKLTASAKTTVVGELISLSPKRAVIKMEKSGQKVTVDSNCIVSQLPRVSDRKVPDACPPKERISLRKQSRRKPVAGNPFACLAAQKQMEDSICIDGKIKTPRDLTYMNLTYLTEGGAEQHEGYIMDGVLFLKDGDKTVKEFIIPHLDRYVTYQMLDEGQYAHTDEDDEKEDVKNFAKRYGIPFILHADMKGTDATNLVFGKKQKRIPKAKKTPRTNSYFAYFAQAQ